MRSKSDFKWFPFFYFHILIFPCPPSSFVLVRQRDSAVSLWSCPSISGYCSCVSLLHSLKKVIPTCPTRAELGTGKTSFVICCQICFYGSKFFCIGLLTANASLSRASCNPFHSGVVPCVKPASLSPSLRVLIAFLSISEALGNDTSGVHMV